ncbi:MAG: DNA mismatch repair protein MutS [Candidatus Hydrogenedentota bacterium]|nr:MAG: DNA mismatch repair protein MutS [Candidatus Hydrogenedentota bacterium]
MAHETPLLKQYRSIKAAYPDSIVMFRIGDFYEMFERDAEIAAKELELTLTSKAMGKAGRLPLAGVPHHSAEGYIARLVRRGYHVAVCDQTEDPAKAKGLVKREVTRVVTPGTYASDESRENTFLATPIRLRNEWAVALCDLFTGELYYAVSEDRSEIEAVLARFRPAEIVLPDQADDEEQKALCAALPEHVVSRIPDWQASPAHVTDLLKRHFRVATLDPLGLGSPEDGVNGAGLAVGILLEYLGATQKKALLHIGEPRRIETSATMVLDPATLLQLEIIESPTGDRRATLRAILDLCVTAAGSRLLLHRLSGPVRNREEILRRLDQVDFFFANTVLRETVRKSLKGVHDIERLAGKLSLGRITPREVLALADSLDRVGSVKKELGTDCAGLERDLDPIPEFVEKIRTRLVDEPPISIGEGPLFREGVDEELDALRKGSRESRRWLAELQPRERERTGISSLKVGYNNVFGYYIEVTKANLEKVPAEYIRKQTLTNAERYYTEELKVHEDRVLRANERMAEVEARLFEELRRELLAYVPRLQRTASAVAVIDVAAALAEKAVGAHYVRPEVIDADHAILRVDGGRHPVVEELLPAGESFVPNDAHLEGERRFMVLTGPNMSGKSTYIRQNALIVLMAQAGSFVPARRCVLTPFDAVFARIGAGDRLARGLSTFMVEMVEAAAILRRATERSLVILDEIGRGTSTYDGLSIAWGIVEALSGRGTLSMFATHYHELTNLEKMVPGVFNATVVVREWNEKIHFLHEIRPGAADRSYGIQVAELAGVPRPVIERAKEILSLLEMGSTGGARLAVLANPDQPTLFGMLADSASSPEGPGEESSPSSRILEEIRNLDPDEMTPREAHARIAEWTEHLRERK